MYKCVSLWDPLVHFPFCGTRCYSILMLTVWANDSKHTVVGPYTLSCVMSNKWSLDAHTLQIICCVSPYQWFFLPPLYWELWPGCHVGAVVCSDALCCRLSSPFSLSFMTFSPCWPLHRLWRLFTCFLLTNLPLYRCIFDNRKFWWCRSEQLNVKTFGLECGENPGCHFLPLEVPLVTRDRP